MGEEAVNSEEPKGVHWSADGSSFSFPKWLKVSLLLLTAFWLYLLFTGNKVLLVETKLERGESIVVPGWGLVGTKYPVTHDILVEELREAYNRAHRAKVSKLANQIKEYDALENKVSKETFLKNIDYERHKSASVELVCKYFNGKQLLHTVYHYVPNNIMGRDSCPFFLKIDD